MNIRNDNVDLLLKEYAFLFRELKKRHYKKKQK